MAVLIGTNVQIFIMKIDIGESRDDCEQRKRCTLPDGVLLYYLAATQRIERARYRAHRNITRSDLCDVGAARCLRTT